MSKITIIGMGELGNTLFSKFRETAHEIKTYDSDPAKTNLNIEESIKNSNIIFLCIPANATESIVSEVVKTGYSGIVASLSKGLTNEGKTVAEKLSELAGEKLSWVIIGGPMISEEIMVGKDSFAVVASKNQSAKNEIASILHEIGINTTIENDPFVVSLFGVLKNIYSVASGIVKGLGLGDNTNGALIVGAISEIKEIATELGFKNLSCDSLSCLGDLVTTSESAGSRNRSMGVELAIKGNYGSYGEAREATHLLLKRVSKDKITSLPILETLAKIIGGQMEANAIKKAILSHYDH